MSHKFEIQKAIFPVRYIWNPLFSHPNETKRFIIVTIFIKKLLFINNYASKIIFEFEKKNIDINPVPCMCTIIIVIYNNHRLDDVPPKQQKLVRSHYCNNKLLHIYGGECERIRGEKTCKFTSKCRNSTERAHTYTLNVFLFVFTLSPSFHV